MILYILCVALILSGCFLFYNALLKKETFFPLNRVVLLSCLVLSFGLPFVPVPEQYSLRKSNRTFKEAPTFTSESSLPQTIEESSLTTDDVKSETSFLGFARFKELSVQQILLTVYWIGVAIFGLNFLFQLGVIYYRIWTRPLIRDGRYRIVELSGQQAPCSFGNYIFINPELYDWDTYSQILLHEKIHIRQGHSYDILLAELALVLQWFNPFAWHYRKAIENNLEFLTDHELLEQDDINPETYQLSLVKVSAPHFPASITTNYNQSMLKKRLLMMKAKKSSINSTWKYLCIFPVLLLLTALFHQPVAFGKDRNSAASTLPQLPTKGNWFATIKGDRIKFRFENDRDQTHSSSEFSRAEIKNLPMNRLGEFILTREAGSIHFKGKFEESQGMGAYEYIPDNAFHDFLQKEGISFSPEKDGMTFFLVNVKKELVRSLKSLGFKDISKNDLIPLTALKIDASYIRSLRNAGLEDVTLKELIPLKALQIDAAFVNDIRQAGYSPITAAKLIPLKAQGIDGATIKDSATASRTKTTRENTSTTVNSPSRDTYKHTKRADEDADDVGMIIAKKVLNVTADFIKSIENTGIKVNNDDLLAMKALGINADYIKAFEKAGYTLNNEQLLGIKSLGITVQDMKAYDQLDLGKMTADDVMAAKSTGTTPDYITQMKKKGHHYKSIHKYIELKMVAAFLD